MTSLPLLAPVFFACLGTACTALLLLDSFHGWLALLLAAVLTAGCVRVVGLDEAVSERAWRVDLAALVVALGFAGFTGAMSGQDLDVVRDPGVYSVTAKWLTDHPDLSIDTEARLFGADPGLTYPSAGFGPTTEPDHVYAQGAHVVPAVLAVVGSLAGDGLMYRTNALVAGFGLLAMYGLGRRLVGRECALVAMTLVACTLPLTAFSRDAYTEPYSMLLVLGGLALLARARSVPSYAVAGLVLGSSCLARIDAYLVLPFVAAYLGLRLAVLDDRPARAREALAVSAAAAVPAFLGWRDLATLAPGYYRDLHGQFTSLMLLLVAALVGVAVLVAAAPLVRRLDPSRLATPAAALIGALGLFLAARPVFYTSHGITDVPQQKAIEALQLTEKVALDGTRSYAEQSVTWQAWYLGPVLAAAALVGVALLVRRALRERDLLAAPFLLVLLATSALYLVNPSITPDQVWAMRRYVPVVMPGAALAGVWALWLGLQRVPYRRTGLAVTAFALLAPLAFLAEPLVRRVELGGQLDEVERVCAALPDDAAVVVTGVFADRYPMTVRTFCHVPTVAAREVAPGRLAVAVQALGDRPLYVVAADDTLLASLPTEVPPTPLSTIKVRHWTRVLTTPPRQAPAGKRSLYVGRVGPGGAVVEWVGP